MNVFSDWPSTHPLTPGGSAIPSLRAPVIVTTSRVSDGELTERLVITMTIPDQTRRKPDGTTLSIGDKIIVQVNPDGSPGAAVGPDDQRYEIVIKNNAVDFANSGMFLGADSGPNRWVFSTKVALNMPGSGDVDFSQTGSEYQITLRTQVRGYSDNFGLAFAIINDLGHNNAGKDEVTAVTFPFGDMPASNTPFLDPGVVETEVAGGPWKTPNRWGIGYRTAPNGPQWIALSHAPANWLSDSIKLSQCNTGRWEDIQPATVGGNQTTLNNWYKYERDNPCKMGVWVNATNTSASAVTARLLVMWADAGLSTKNWRVVELTPPTSFGAGSSISRAVWDKVPAAGSVPGGTTHPCLRVYVLPSSLAAVDPNTGVTFDETRINAINNAVDLAGMERAYGFPSPWNQRVAQMNFTNLATGGCTNASCTQPSIISSLDGLFELTSGTILPAAFAQPAPGVAVPPVRVDNQRPDWIYAAVEGFAVPDPLPSAPYVFIEPVGGVAWGIPASVAAEKIALGFQVTNPEVAYRNFGTSPVTEIQAPRRRISLVSSMKVPAGVEAPKITLPGDSSVALGPGESVSTTATVAPAADTGGKGCLESIGLADAGMLGGGAVMLGFLAHRPRRRQRGD